MLGSIEEKSTKIEAKRNNQRGYPDARSGNENIQGTLDSKKGNPLLLPSQ
jgi:hypothetical protein